MKTLFATFTVLFVTASGYGITLDCSASHNTKVIYTQRINIDTRSRGEVKLPQVDYITPKLKSMGNNQYEIEVFNPNVPARYYSTAVLKTAGDFVKWASWDRDAIFEIGCVQR
tara:strand:- start:20962 stop:21300 length:339 start_codon:yes stop_codon:yes gene_type:complete